MYDYLQADLRRANIVSCHVVESSLTTAWGVSGSLTSASVFTAQHGSSGEYLHSSQSVFCWLSPTGFIACCSKDLFYFDSWLFAFWQTLQPCVCFCKAILCMSAWTTWQAWSIVQNGVCVRGEGSAVQAMVASKWRMKRPHLRKWPLGAMLSVLEGLQGHYTHCTHYTNTHRYLDINVCPGGTVGLLPY